MNLLTFFLVLVALTFGQPILSDDSGPFEPLTFQNGIQFNDDTGNFQTNLRFRMQNLMEYQSVAADNFDPRSIQMMVRRLRLRFAGHVVDPRLKYSIQLSFANRDMDWSDTSFPHVVRDATIVYQLMPNWQLSYGQTKLPGNRQRVISSGDQQFADRSIVNARFNIDRDFALQTMYANELGGINWNVRLAASSGEGRNVSSVVDGQLASTSRLEILPFGLFTDNGDYFEGDLSREQTPKLSYGLGYSYMTNVKRLGGTIGPLVLTAVLGQNFPKSFGMLISDFIFKYRGFSLYGEYMRRDISNPTYTGSTSVAIYKGDGINLQAGYFFWENTEIVARFATTRPDRDIWGIQPSSGKSLAHAETHHVVGYSYYIRKHRVKIQQDISYIVFENLSAGGKSDNWGARVNFELGI